MFYDKPTDVVSYLPEKLRSIVEFGAIGDAVNPEIDKLNAAVGLMAANAFIDTVDMDGLKRWEKILGVTSPLTVYKQRIINDPYHFAVASEKDYVKEIVFSGNAIQNGIPTPEAPITPMCLPAGTKIPIIGANHLNINESPASTISVLASLSNNVLTLVSDSAAYAAKYVLSLRVTPNTRYYVSLKAQQSINYADTDSSILIRTGASSGDVLNQVILEKNTEQQQISFYFDSGAYGLVYFWFYARRAAIANRPSTITYSDVMVSPQNIPYEPYTNPTTLTVPCDLWKVTAADSLNWLTGVATQRIFKRVLSGTENWTLQGSNSNNITSFSLVLSTAEISPASISVPSLCSHFPYNATSLASSTSPHTFVQRTSTNTALYIRVYTNDIADVISFKNWIAAQYAAGTPVTVWYELATPIQIQYPPQPINLPQGVVNVVVESSNGVLPSSIDITLAEYQSDETFQARKNAIKSKLMTKPPINLETLRTIIEAYMGVEVEITIADSIVSVVYRGDTEVIDLSPLYATLYETIPANLLVEIAYKYLQWLELDAQGLNFDALDAFNMDWNEFERGEWIG